MTDREGPPTEAPKAGTTLAVPPPPIGRARSPISGEAACIAGPTSPFPDVGCGDVEEYRVPLSFAASTDVILALVDPASAVAVPDARMTVVGVDPGAPLVACHESLAETTGPVAEVALEASNYDLIITTANGGVQCPVVVRRTDSLCPVDSSCCDPDGDSCSDAALSACVGAFDRYCTDVAWDATCVNLAVAVCGAACNVLG